MNAMEVVRLAPRAAVLREWTPATARQLGLRYIVERQTSALAGLVRAGPQAAQDEHRDLDGLLVNLHEPLFTYPAVFGRLEAMKRIRRSSRILDHGCGAGYYSIALALAGHEVACWDTNPKALACIEYVAGALGLQATRGKLTGSYDAALCINVLDHTTEPENCLGLIEASLAPGAPLYLHADFHNDGLHVSCKEGVDRAFRALATRFARGGELGDWLQLWHRRHLRSPSGDGLLPEIAQLEDPGLRPAMSAAVELEHTDDGGAVVTGKVFYVRPCRLARAAVRILLACDGMTTMRDLTRRMKPFAMSGEDVRRVVAELWDRRIIVVKTQTP
ncbi:MAG: class I SAM-dependent methyltransferase [Reyranellaceae bacterium]